MSAPILTTSSTIICPHGGQATLLTANTGVEVAGGKALLESDVHPVVGCPFTLPGPKYSPCVRIEWSAGSTGAKVNGTPVLIATSIGKCLSAEGAMQGAAIIIQTQPRGTA